MAASAAATRSRSIAWSTSSRAALYCGSHSGNFKWSFIRFSVGLRPGASSERKQFLWRAPWRNDSVALEKVEQGIPRGWPVSGGTRTVAHGGHGGGCVTRRLDYTPVRHRLLGFDSDNGAGLQLSPDKSLLGRRVANAQTSFRDVSALPSELSPRLCLLLNEVITFCNLIVDKLDFYS